MEQSKRPTILIVEDEQSLSQPLSIELKQHGVESLFAETVTEAQILLQNHPNIKLISLDHYLPGGDGLILAEFIKENEQFKHIPILVLTNATEDETKIHYLNLGVQEYFVKTNVSLKDVVAHINNLIAN